MVLESFANECVHNLFVIVQETTVTKVEREADPVSGANSGGSLLPSVTYPAPEEKGSPECTAGYTY